MILGLCIKKDETYNYSKPLLLHEDKKYFDAQSIRDVDFSLIAKSNDNLEIFLIEYPSNNYYRNCNINNIDPRRLNIKIFGCYLFTFIAEKNKYQKNNFITNLDNNNNTKLILDLSYIFR